MHEAAIVQSLLERIDEEARRRGATSVGRISVRLGELAGVEPQLLSRAFDTFRERTICAGARLDLLPSPARWACPDCGRGPHPGDGLRCPRHRRPLRLVAGDEIVLERIEMEVP